MRNVDLDLRTKQFALRIIKMCDTIPSRHRAGDVLCRQILRSGTSVGAQYREAQRARSLAEFISKIESASQELAETEYWIELLAETELVSASRLTELLKETRELTAIFVTSANTAKRRRRNENKKEA